MTEPIYYKAKRFFPTKNYEIFSKLYNRTEIISYDTMLCKVIIEQGIECFATDFAGEVLDWKSLLQTPLKSNEQIIAYYKNPTESHENHILENDFEFCGYDLSEETTFISAITNCGEMFHKVIPCEKINKFGLINEYNTAFQICDLLDEVYPNESHAGCEVYELWRKL